MARCNKPYRSLVGNLMYLSVVRPDICFAVYNLAQFDSNPGKVHWVVLKHLLCYLKGSTNFTLVFNRGAAFELFGYCDTDWATDEDDRKSISGFCFEVIRDNSVVSWASKKQACVALSSCEAENVVLASVAQEAIFMQALLAFISCSPMVTKPTLVSHKRAKHIETRHHFIRDLIEAKKLQLEYTPTADIVADIFTKNLPKPAFMQHRNQIFCQP